MYTNKTRAVRCVFVLISTFAAFTSVAVAEPPDEETPTAQAPVESPAATNPPPVDETAPAPEGANGTTVSPEQVDQTFQGATEATAGVIAPAPGGAGGAGQDGQQPQQPGDPNRLIREHIAQLEARVKDLSAKYDTLKQKHIKADAEATRLEALYTQLVNANAPEQAITKVKVECQAARDERDMHKKDMDAVNNQIAALFKELDALRARLQNNGN